ncbi:MAG: DUF3536 domain-containing protein [Flexilinea sp.]|nr:DUF3536 domain-containing protein [Flexilinea sp.]
MPANQTAGQPVISKQSFCVHGHFYQPPREDPFTGRIPIERGAFPFDNWNEKIYDQCYRPNAELGNFSRISFNIGPTLANWMEEVHPDTYHKIIEQENEAHEKTGLSNAMAQAYNHTILPLATRADKETQVRWGLIDFEHRFGHRPQGMWLPETAVDLETLQVLAEAGVEFTILAPWQANTRKPVNPGRPYSVSLGGGKRISVFFYDSDLSMKVSFMPEATVNADGFVYEHLLPQYNKTSRVLNYRLIASDGELYGHHQPLREYFLHWLTTGALTDQPIDCVFPAQILRQYPPTLSVRIKDNTSWSCHHGVKRWDSECPCAEHGEWKHGMRHAFDRIAEYVDTEMQKALDPYGLDLQEFRNEYAYVLTGQETAAGQLRRLIGKELPKEEEEKLLSLMKAQYERQRMFTSCGWFFGDFERIEARNNLAYAAMAVYLLEEVTGNKDYYRKIHRALTRVVNGTTGVRASTIFSNAFFWGN